MDYEKRYKEALERAKKLASDLPNGRNDRIYHIWDLESIFPELAESEDERIRKEIKDVFCSLGEGKIPVSINFADIFDWLEKQDPKKHEEELEKAYKCADEVQYRRGYEDAKQEFEKQGKQTSMWKHWKAGIAGNGEGEIIYLVKMNNTYRLTSCLGFECDYIELSELDSHL